MTIYTDNKKRILKILMHIFGSKKGEERVHILALCSVKDQLGRLDPNADPMMFCIALCNAFVSDEKLFVVFFDQYLENIFSLSETIHADDADYIRCCLQNHKSVSIPDNSFQKQTAGNFERSDVNGFDLTDMVSAFFGSFKDPEGIFGFSIGGNSHFIVREYFIDRLLRTYRGEVRNQEDATAYQVFELILSSNDESKTETDIAAMLEEDVLKSSLRECFEREKSKDLIVMIWNNNFATEDFTPLAERAWQDLLVKSTFLKGSGRILITFWINNLHPPTHITHERFKILPGPDEITDAHLIKVDHSMRKRKVDELDRQRRKNQLVKVRNNSESFYFLLHTIFNTIGGAQKP